MKISEAVFYSVKDIINGISSMWTQIPSRNKTAMWTQIPSRNKMVTNKTKNNWFFSSHLSPNNKTTVWHFSANWKFQKVFFFFHACCSYLSLPLLRLKIHLQFITLSITPDHLCSQDTLHCNLNVRCSLLRNNVLSFKESLSHMRIKYLGRKLLPQNLMNAFSQHPSLVGTFVNWNSGTKDLNFCLRWLGPVVWEFQWSRKLHCRIFPQSPHLHEFYKWRKSQHKKTSAS